MHLEFIPNCHHHSLEPQLMPLLECLQHLLILLLDRIGQRQHQVRVQVGLRGGHLDHQLVHDVGLEQGPRLYLLGLYVVTCPFDYIVLILLIENTSCMHKILNNNWTTTIFQKVFPCRRYFLRNFRDMIR